MLTREGTTRVIILMAGVHQLVVKILNGCGLRIIECLRLRVQDVDLAMKVVTVRDGKGAKDRLTTFSVILVRPLEFHSRRVGLIHEQDLKDGFGGRYLPYTLGSKYPRAASQWKWHFVFPASRISTVPRTGVQRRLHLDPSPIESR